MIGFFCSKVKKYYFKILFLIFSDENAMVKIGVDLASGALRNI